MSTKLRRGARWAIRGALALAVGLAANGVGATAALAQLRTERDFIVAARSMGIGDTPDFNVTQARRGFRLFASADAGGVGMHGTGNFGYALDNYGPCDAPLSGFCAWNVRPRRNTGIFSFQFFEVIYRAGASPTDWARARQQIPSLANVRGGGWTSSLNFGLFSGRAEWGPHDNTLSKLFSGVASTEDGTCRDNTSGANGFYPDGLPLLAASNCPDTWANGVWGGDRTAPVESWKQLFDAQGAAFAFDYWRMPDDLKRTGPFMGTNFSSYGETSDFYTDILPTYGSAIPGGTDDPGVDGYPLGLVWRFEAFNFGVPSLSGVAFWRATVINRSQDLYGVGINYDSLYLGFGPGTGGAGGGGGQAYSNYYLPDISTALYHQSNVQGAGGPCGDPSRQPPGVGGCANPASPGAGYGNGGNAIIVLKSPIGDLRNKLFSRTTSGAPCAIGVDPFCDPAHPLADDTITFNHGHICGYGSCWDHTHNVNDRRSFGMLSSTEANVLDARDVGSLTDFEAFTTFRSAGFPGQRGTFNRYVPGVQGPPAATWDWNDDGQPDTLYYDTCHSNGCVVTDGDTLPGGQKLDYGNVGGTLAAGPIPLAAGDSTSWFVAFVGEMDSSSTWAAINAAIDVYLNFFLAPEAPPVARVASTQVVAATADGENQAAEVSIFFTEDPERWVDPFLTKLADDIAAAAPGTPLGDLAATNPGLETLVRDRAADNLEQIEVYKSCNGGDSFTSDADCDGDPARDEQGRPAGLGWEAYTIYNLDALGGDIPNAFVDDDVQGGRTYLYVFVGKSRGANFALNRTAALGGGIGEVEFSPTIRNVLSSASSDPNVASVYVPASRSAGYQPAQITFTQIPSATVPFTINAAEAPRAGTYVAQFANRFTVERDSLITEEEVDGTRVIVERVVNASPAATPTVVRTDTLFLDGDAVLPVAGTGTTSTATIGNVFRTTSVYAGLGFVTASGTSPIFVSTTLTGAAATPTAVFALADFPGFTITANNDAEGDYNINGEITYRGALSKQLAGLPDTADVVPVNNVSRFMVRWRDQNSASTVSGRGRYLITWSSDAYGLERGIVLNLANPSATEAELAAALAARPATLTGLTDAETANLLAVPQPDLVAVRVPFTVRNTTFGRDVEVAMVRRLDNTYLLGAGFDTIRVLIPEAEWVPGDILAFIENVERDSADAGGLVLDGSGQPLRTVSRLLTFTDAVLGCNSPRPPACNPVGVTSRGQTGYLPKNQGDSLAFEYHVGFTDTDRYAFDLVAPVAGADITSVTEDDLSRVRVVPNPFVIFSQYQENATESRILFTNMPPTGTLRVYTVSGQFVQQVNWTPDDLVGQGDLFYNLKSREDIDIAGGLYIWVLTAPSDPTNPNSAPVVARGKFVVIRGRPR
jgi:hypothetical protein